MLKAREDGSDEEKEVLPKGGGEVTDDRARGEEEKLPQEAGAGNGCRCRRAKGDMAAAAMVGVMASQKEESEDAEEETGDQAEVSTSQRPPSSTRAEGGGIGKDRRVLTLEYRDSNGFDGRVTALRPRKRAKYSHRRMACMVWRLHWGICCCWRRRGGLVSREGALLRAGHECVTHPLHLLPCKLVQLVSPGAVLPVVQVLRGHGRHGAS